MIRESEILGLTVMVRSNGKKLGTIKKIIYSKNRLRMLAILIDEGGYFKEPKVIRFKNINLITQGMIIIENKDIIEIASSIPQISEALIKDTGITNNEIISDNGEDLGYVKDVLIDERNGKVVGFIVTEGIVEDLRRGRSVLPRMEGISYGENKLIISSKIKEELYKYKDDYKKLLELQM